MVNSLDVDSSDSRTPDLASSESASPATPAVYGGRTARSAGSAKAPLVARAVGLALALGCLAVLIVAASLQPSKAGYGSHTGLGLQGCQFMTQTGLPCPSCGMTTSFTWFVRGNVPASLYVQPMGTILAALAGCCVWAGLYVALTGRPVYRLLRLLPGRTYTLPLLTLALLAWGWKIFIHLKGWDGWG